MHYNLEVALYLVNKSSDGFLSRLTYFRYIF